MTLHRVIMRSLLGGVLICHVTKRTLIGDVMIHRDAGMFVPDDVMIRRAIRKLLLDDLMIRRPVRMVLPDDVVIHNVDGPHHPRGMMTCRDVGMFLLGGTMALLVGETFLPVIGMILLVTHRISWSKIKWTVCE